MELLQLKNIRPNLLLGFTLLEVLVALVILATAFITVFSAISANINSYIRFRDKTAASWVAMNVLAEMQINQLLLTNQSSAKQGETTLFNLTWYWNITVESTSYPLVNEVKVSIFDRQSHEILSMTGYLRNAA